MKWPWKRPQVEREPLEPTDRALLLALQETTSRLRADFDLLSLEWSSVLDKIKAWAGREAARRSKATQKALEESAQEAAGDTNAAPQDIATLSKADLRRLAAQRFSRQNGGTR